MILLYGISGLWRLGRADHTAPQFRPIERVRPKIDNDEK
jgi:hypothetical protein